MMTTAPDFCSSELPPHLSFSVSGAILRLLASAEYGGTVGVNLVPCTVFGRRAFILRTDKEEAGQGSHPFEVIEVATDIKLRETYGLIDGSMVEIELE